MEGDVGSVFVGYGETGFGYVNVQEGAAPTQVEGEAGPLFGQEGLEVQVLADDFHAAKSIDDGHPGTAHGSDVEALVYFVVVIVQVQTGRAQVQLIGLLLVAEAAGQNGVHTGAQGAFVNG